MVLVYVDQRLEKLIPKFIAAQKIQLELMKEAFQKLNYEDLRLLGHRMKGSCGGYGFSVLGELGNKVEIAAEVGNLDQLSMAMAELENCFSNLKIEYQKV